MKGYEKKNTETYTKIEEKREANPTCSSGEGNWYTEVGDGFASIVALVAGIWLLMIIHCVL
jgi:hypothetical protein